jgi:capsular exopolysaccharide synthesis family protein
MDFNSMSNNNTKFMKNQNNFSGSEILTLVLAKWWLVLSLFVCLAATGFAIGKLTYVPKYTSGATFVVSGRASDSSTTVIDQKNNMTLSQSLINTFPYILLSDDGIAAILEELKTETQYRNLKSSDLKRAIKVVPIEETDLLLMTVTTTDKDLSVKIARGVLTNYPVVLNKTIKENANLEVLNSPQKPSFPDPYRNDTLYAVIGGLLGLFISIGFILLVESFRNSAKKIEDITQNTDMTVMVSVPEIIKGKDTQGLLITNKATGFGFIETYKSLRTKIEHLATKKKFKTFLITSAVENEGKTTVLVNTAIALAQNGKKVLIIDSDLRKPSVCKLLEIKDTIGKESLTMYLKGEAEIYQITKYIEQYNISVITPIKGSSGSTELLSSEKMKNLIELAAEEFDYVLLDTAPVSIVADAEILSSYVDAAIMVVRYDFASIYDITVAADTISMYKAELVGCVFNALDYSEASYSRGYSRKSKYKRKYAGYYKYNSYGTE